MAHIVKHAQDNSGFLNLLKKQGFNDPHQYKLRTNLQPQSFHATHRSTFQQIRDGQVVRFPVDRKGVWKHAYFLMRADYAPDGSSVSEIATLVGAAIITRIELRSRERILGILYPADIVFYAQQHAVNPAQSTWAGRSGINLLGEGGIQTNPYDLRTSYFDAFNHLDFIVPLPFSVFSNEKVNLYTKFVEQLEIHVHVHPNAEARSRESKSVWNGHWKLQLCSDYVEPAETTKQLLLNEMRMIKSGKQMGKLVSSSFQEQTQSLGSALTSVTFNIQCPYPTFYTMFYVTTDDEAATQNCMNMVHASSAGDKLIFDKVTLLSGNTVLLEYTYQDLILHMLRHKQGASLDVFADDSANTYGHDRYGHSILNSIYMLKLFWNEFIPEMIGCAPDLALQAGTVQTGCINWKYLTNPRIKLDYIRDGSDDTLTVHMVHQYHQFMITNPDNGKVEVVSLF